MSLKSKVKYFCFQILDHADKWGVDMFRIAEITDNKTLTCVTYTIFQVKIYLFHILKFFIEITVISI